VSDALGDALSWLGERQAGVPEALRAALHNAVVRVGHSQTMPERVLRVAADLVLTETVAPDTPNDPVRLLTADALITYVCEYRSEFAPDMLETLL